MERSTISIVSDNLAPKFLCRRLLRDQERQPLTIVLLLGVLEAYFFHMSSHNRRSDLVIANPNQIILSKSNIVHCRRRFEA